MKKEQKVSNYIMIGFILAEIDDRIKGKRVIVIVFQVHACYDDNGYNNLWNRAFGKGFRATVSV